MVKVVHQKNKSCFDGWSFGDDPEGFFITPSDKTIIPNDWLKKCFEEFMDCVLDETNVHFMEYAYGAGKDRPSPMGKKHPLDMYIEFGANGHGIKSGPVYMFNLFDELRLLTYPNNIEDFSKELKIINDGLKDLIDYIDKKLFELQKGNS